jgi:ribokinase
MSRPLVTVVGSANQDILAQVERLPSPGETILGHDLVIAAGGKGLNQAVAAARAAARTAFVGLVGDDPAGANLRSILSGEGIDIRALGRAGPITGRALIAVAGDGDNQIIVVPGANWAMTPRYVDDHRDRITHASVLLCQLEIPLEAVERALSLAHTAGVCTLLNAAPPRPLEHDLLALVDVLLVNEHEAAILASLAVASIADAELAGRALVAQGCGAAIVTMGAAGAVLVSSAGVRHQPAFAVPVLDSTGAGDAFAGGLAARLAAGDDLEAALHWATAAGSLAVTTFGAVPSIPMEADVERLLSAAR